MQFIYGAYYHSPNSVFFKSINRQFVRGQTQRIHLARTSWALEGKLLGVSVEDIQGQLQVLQAAYAIDDRSAVMVNNNGIATDWIVDTAQTVGGVRVTNPISHEGISGAHGITYLKYNFGLTWDVLWAANQDVLEFAESLDFHDNQGLPLTIERLPQNGPPIIQAITQSSFYYCTQSGMMKQSGPNPMPAQPSFPGYFRGQEGSNSVTQLPTRAIRGDAFEYGCRWKYDYVSTTPFFGATPNYR